MRCSGCENEVRPGEKFCRFCGTPVSLIDVEESTLRTKQKEGLKCNQCGANIITGNKYCIQCGAPVKDDKAGVDKNVASPNSDYIVCNSCGEVVEGENAFCTNCGAVLRGNENENRTSRTRVDEAGERKKEKPKRVRRFLIITIIIAILLVICAGGVILKEKGLIFNEKRSEEETNLQMDESITQSETEQPIVSQDPDLVSDDQSPTGAEGESVSDSSNGIEEKITAIDSKCREIADGMLSGKYKEVITDHDVSGYYDNNEIKEIETFKSETNEYIGLGFDQGKIIMGEYQGTNEKSLLYFENEKLIRWQYYPDTSSSKNYENYENYDMDSSDEYKEWENVVLLDAKQYKKELEDYQKTKVKQQDESEEDNTETVDVDDYIFPNGDSVYLTKKDLNVLSEKQCRLAINEFYARHGRRFKDKELQNYFNQFDWYNPSVDPDDFSESVFNKYEKENVKKLNEYAKKKGWR